MLLKFLILVTLLHFKNAYAFPTYVRLGYNNCTGCHVSSQGGGILTNYGKGIAMTQSLKSTDPEDEETKSFLWAFQARAMRYKTEADVRVFPMQSDLLMHDRVAEKISVDGVLAMAPRPKDETPENKKPLHERLYARVFQLNFILSEKLNQEDRISIGISPLPMGIGILDHTAFVRAENRFQVTDNPVQLKFYQARQKYLAHHFVFGPNPNEGEGNREKGIGTQTWYRPFPQLSIGAQALYGDTDSITRKMAGALLKAGIGRWALLFEYDFTKRDLKLSNSDFNQKAIFTQLSFYPVDYLSLYASTQSLERDNGFEGKQKRNSFGTELRILSNLSASYEYRIAQIEKQKDASQLLQLSLNWW